MLVILAVPPILSNTYAGIANVDPAARDAARGMGMTGPQVLTRVELPVAMPLIMSGVRSAFLQVVATATIAAVVSLGGFGRYVIDGLAQSDYPMMVAGALLVAVLAIIGDRILAVIGHFVVSPGLTGRADRRRRPSATTADLVVARAEPGPADDELSGPVPMSYPGETISTCRHIHRRRTPSTHAANRSRRVPFRTAGLLAAGLAALLTVSACGSSGSPLDTTSAAASPAPVPPRPRAARSSSGRATSRRARCWPTSTRPR